MVLYSYAERASLARPRYGKPGCYVATTSRKKKQMKNIMSAIRSRLLAFVAFALAFVVASVPAQAQTDIAAVLTTVSDYKDDAILVGVAILLFVLGRSIVRKLAK